MQYCEINGNLLETPCDIICHQVNCMGVMGSGIAKQIKEKWPKVYREYNDYVNLCRETKTSLLAKTLFVDISEYYEEKGHSHYKINYVCNLFGQYFYGTEKRQTNYGAVAVGLERLRRFVNEHYNYKECIIGFPWKMCSDRGGADWNKIMKMILTIFKNENVIIKFVKYNGE